MRIGSFGSGIMVAKLRIVILLLLLLASLLAAEPAEITPAAIQNVDNYLAKASRNDYAGSILVAYQGKILLEKGYGMADRKRSIPFEADTVFDIGSLTKQFTAAGILKLEMEKKLSVNDSIALYIEGVPEDKKALTLHQLLTHTAGLPDAVGEDEELVTKEEYLKRVFATPLRGVGNYAYSNVGFSLLAMVIEKASGKEYEHYINEVLFTPAGMKSTGYVLPKWNKDKVAIGYSNNREWGRTMDMSHYEKGVTWHLKGNGGIHSTVHDMYRWYLALQGNEILSEEAKKKLFGKHAPVQEGEYYAYGWAVQTKQPEHITHNGGNGYFMATVSMVPAKDFVVIASSNNNPKNTDQIASRVEKFLFENLQPLDDKFRNTYSGDYVLPGNGEFRVAFDENDSAQLALNEPKSFQLLSGSKEDDPKLAAAFNSKSGALWKAVIAKDYDAAIAVAPAGVTEEEARRFLPQMRNEFVESAGELISADILGSVSRRNGTIYLTVARITGAKGTVFQFIIWRQGEISEMRSPEAANNKSFEMESPGNFYSESNNVRLQFRMENGKPATVIGQIVALKKTPAKE